MPRVPTVAPKGAVIKDLRERSGLSRAQLAKKINRGEEMIRLIESDRRASRLFLCQIAKALKIDVDNLIEPDTESDVAA